MISMHRSRAWLSVLAAASFGACAEATPPPVPPAVVVAPAPPSAPSAPPAPPPPTAPLGADDLHLALAVLNGPLPRLIADDRTRVLAQALTLTDKLLAKARPEDRALLEKGAVILHELEAYDGVERLARGVFDRVVELDRAWITLYPDDAGVKLWLAATLSDLNSIMVFEGFEPARKDAEIAEANAIVRALADRFPDDAHVQSARGDVCISERDDGADCMRRFARCLKLDPSMSSCAERLDFVKKRYLAPYCAGADVRRGFEVRIAEGRDRKAVKEPITLAKLVIGPPVVRAVEVDEVASVPVDSGAPWVRIGIAPAGRGDAKGAAKAVEKRVGMLFALMDGGSLVGTARSYDVSPDGSALTWMKGASLERVCRKISRRVLPGDLVAP